MIVALLCFATKVGADYMVEKEEKKDELPKENNETPKPKETEITKPTNEELIAYQENQLGR